MVKVCSNKFVQCALKQTKPLLMGNVAVFILLFCSWHYLLHVSLDYYKVRGLCVIMWEPSLPVAAIGVDRHLPLSSRKYTSSASLFPWAGAICHVYLVWASRREADLSCCLQLQSYPCKKHLYGSHVSKISVQLQEGRRFCMCWGEKGGKAIPAGILLHLEHSGQGCGKVVRK